MKDIVSLIRILDNNTIKIPINYALDEEHGLEIKIKNNKVADIAGIAETNRRLAEPQEREGSGAEVARLRQTTG